MVNFPVKGKPETIICEVKESVSGHKWFDIRNSNGYAIEELHEGDAHHLARSLTEARDAGVAQGLKSVRIALGM